MFIDKPCMDLIGHNIRVSDQPALQVERRGHAGQFEGLQPGLKTFQGIDKVPAGRVSDQFGQQRIVVGIQRIASIACPVRSEALGVRGCVG